MPRVVFAVLVFRFLKLIYRRVTHTESSASMPALAADVIGVKGQQRLVVFEKNSDYV